MNGGPSQFDRVLVATERAMRVYWTAEEAAMQQMLVNHREQIRDTQANLERIAETFRRLA